MAWSTPSLATLLLLSASATAAETSPTGHESTAGANSDAPNAPEGTPAESEPVAGEKTIRVVVPQLQSHGVAEALAINLSGIVLLRLQDVPGTSVIGHANIERLLDQRQQQRLAGCGTDAACAAGIVGALDASRLVWGSVRKEGNRFIVSLTLLDTTADAVVRRTSRTAVSVDKLVEATSDAADALWLAPDLPADGCLDCGATPTAFQIAVKFGNNFMSVFQSGVDVSLFGPGLDLDLGYRFAGRLASFLTVGLAFGRRKNDDGGRRFLVIPLNLGVRYHSKPLIAGLAAFGGLSLGVGFINTAVWGGDEDLGPSFAGKLHTGLYYALHAEFGAVLEASYQLTTTTPADLARRPLSAAALKLGVAYGF